VEVDFEIRKNQVTVRKKYPEPKIAYGPETYFFTASHGRGSVECSLPSRDDGFVNEHQAMGLS
jgi:hypothetical protein